MSNDWYTEGFDRLMKETARDYDVDEDTVRTLYRHFAGLGLAGDYDVEKEIIWDLYYDDES